MELTLRDRNEVSGWSTPCAYRTNIIEHLCKTTYRKPFKSLKKELAVPGSPLLELLVLGPRSDRDLDPALRHIDEATISDRLGCFVIPEECLAGHLAPLGEDVDPCFQG